MNASRLILIGAVASAVVTTIVVLIFAMGLEENQNGIGNEQTPTGSKAPQQNGPSSAEKVQESNGKGVIGDWDLG